MEKEPIIACQPLEVKTYNKVIPEDIECCIGADICGRNSDFGVFEVHDNIPTLLFSLHTKTESIKDFPKVICDVMAYAQNKYNINIKLACIGAPGIATENRVCVYGLFDIDSKEIMKQSGLIKALVVNDLVVMGHGLEAVDKNKIIQVYGDSSRGESSQEHGIRAIIGAKAGLGSCTQIWNELIEQYITHPGEGGIVEFAPNNQLEFDMAEHIKQTWNSQVVYWDAFVSGCGIKRIYNILKLSNKYNDSLILDVAPEPAVIFAHPDDELCKATTNLFFTFYARFTRNHVFPILPYGGLYMTGSIAAKNVELFSTLFVPEYDNCVPCLQNILKRIPVYVVTDNNLSLYGAAQCLLREKKLS